MSKRSPWHHLRAVSFAGTHALYDTNRVTTYTCSALEASLLAQIESGRTNVRLRSSPDDRQGIDEALARLEDLADLSTRMGDRQGFVPHYSGHPTYLLLHLCASCNLRCTYCYNEACDTNDACRQMTARTAQASIDDLFKHAEPGAHCTLVFAGGEPLLNFKVLKSAAEYARAQSRQRGVGLNLRILTNGTVMSPAILEFIAGHGISLQISLDGPPELHDRLRPTKAGHGSSNKIMETLAFMKRAGFSDYRIRSTFCHRNADLSRIVDYFHEQGLKNFVLCPVQTGKPNPHTLRKSDLVKIAAYYQQMCAATIATVDGPPGAVMPEAFAPYVQKLKLGLKTKRYCGAGRDMRVVAPDGRYYPCPVFVGDDRYCTGSADGRSLSASSIAFPNRSVDEKQICRRCWARNLCGGGCVAQALRRNDDPERPDPLECALTRAKIKGAIAIYQQQKIHSSRQSV